MDTKIAEIDAKELVSQLRAAHCLAVGFYQRLLQQLTSMSNELNLSFWYWEPSETSMPCRRQTAPVGPWAWDMVPLFASTHVYRRVADAGLAQEGDIAVSFQVYLDDNFTSQKRKSLGIKGQPDPLTLPAGEAIVRVDLFRCDGQNGENFTKAWQDSEWPDSEGDSWKEVGANMKARVKTYHLDFFITHSDHVVKEIDELLAR